MKNEKWSRHELIVAFNLYCKLPFTKINATNKAVKDLAEIIGRSNSSVALKLANYARLDPDLQKRNVAGMTHGSKGEIDVRNEFAGNWEELAYQSELILAEYQHESVEEAAEIDQSELPKEGKEREAIVKIRVNQLFFRKAILASYDSTCCITGITNSELLVASHIKPWAIDTKNRMNPCNGLCLNALHDRAFDKGLITVANDLTLRVSSKLKKDAIGYSAFFKPYDGIKIRMPDRFLPDIEFIQWHNDVMFEKVAIS